MPSPLFLWATLFYEAQLDGLFCRNDWGLKQDMAEVFYSASVTSVSYTHLTLPTRSAV